MQTCAPPALSQADADRVFAHLRDHRPDIPFDYPIDCCWTRAREIANELGKEGVPVRKEWNYGALHVNSPNGLMQPDGSRGVRWGWHVAPYAPVRGNDGTVRNMIFDPSMEISPVPVERWIADQNDPHSRSYSTSADVYFSEPPGVRTATGITEPDPGDAEVSNQFAIHREQQETLRAAGQL